MERLDRLIDQLRPYRKAVVAWAIPVILAVQSVAGGGIDTAEWFTIVLAALGAQGVYQIRNGGRDDGA